MRILFIGDIFGRPGRNVVREQLEALVVEHGVHLVIANGENAAGGFGITPALAEELLELGVDVVTTGNHIWDKREIMEYFETANGSGPARRVLRPANFPASLPGTGVFEGRTHEGVDYAVINLQGRVFMSPNDDPFRAADQLLKNIKAKVRVLDFHAEATSEKVAMGWYLDGRVSAVIGTHTHIPTADETILPKGTAYLTDVGMTGPFDSVIGVEKALVIERFLTQRPVRFQTAEGDVRLYAALVDIDASSGRASKIERVIVRE